MSLLKNSTIVVIGVIISNALAYAFHFIAGRMLGPEEYGVFGALMSLYLLVALPAGALGFAIAKYASRFHSANDPGKIDLMRKKIQKDVLIFSAIILLLTGIFSKFIAHFLRISSIMPVIIIGITLLFALLLPINNGILLGLKKFGKLSLNAVIEAVSRLALLVLFLYLGYGANGAIAAYGLAYLVAYLWVFQHIREIKKANTGLQHIEIRPIYKFIFQVLVVNIFIQSILNIPSLFIKHFYSSEFTGYWTGALNIARISLFITSAISMVMFPHVSSEKEHDAKKKIFYRALILVLVASVCLAVLMNIIPVFLIKSLYGTAYAGAAPILEWMGFAMILIGLLQLWANYYLARLK